MPNDQHYHQAGSGCCPHPDCVKLSAPSGSLSIEQQNNFREHCRKQAEEIEKHRALIAMHSAKANNEYWVWMGDGTDLPESLTCPVLAPAHVVREWIARHEKITVEDLDNLRHMLGISERNKRSLWGFRNHYYAEKGNHSMRRLIAHGFVVEIGGHFPDGDAGFRATRDGCLAVGMLPREIEAMDPPPPQNQGTRP